MLTGCGDSGAPGVSSEPEEMRAHAAYNAGYDLLFNVATRFEYPQAIEMLEEAVAEDERHAPTRVALSYAYTKQGQYAKAEPHVKVAQTLASDLSEKPATLAGSN